MHSGHDLSENVSVDVRATPELLVAIDSLVEEGGFDTRSQAVRAALAAATEG
jgi:Arc/MetJ-type ribon-helix-helix transcriptional regulator